MGDPSANARGMPSDASLREASGGRSDMTGPETIEGSDETIRRDHETICCWGSMCHENGDYSLARLRSTELPQILNLPHFRHVDRT